MTDDRSVVDQALDLLVYAPVGLALEAKELIPRLAERGRGQIALVRLAGRFAADRGQREVRRLLGEDDARSGRSRRSTVTITIDPPFPGYDDLPAREVIEVLPDLAPDQLDEIDAYERHHRSRATILGRLDQLRS